MKELPPSPRRQHGDLPGEVSIEAGLAHPHAGHVHERALAIVERCQLHEHARWEARFTAQRDPNATGGSGAPVEDGRVVDVSIEDVSEPLAREFTDLDRIEAGITSGF